MRLWTLTPATGSLTHLYAAKVPDVIFLSPPSPEQAAFPGPVLECGVCHLLVSESHTHLPLHAAKVPGCRFSDASLLGVLFCHSSHNSQQWK